MKYDQLKEVKVILKLVVVINLIILVNSTNAQSTVAKTLQYDSSKPSPKARLSDIQWLQGYWKGAGLGGETEEIWSAPGGGSMVGIFRLVAQQKTSFYEMMTIMEENGSLVFRLKHFDPDMKGWEEKDHAYKYPLVKVTPDRVYFNEYTFEKARNDQLYIHVVLGGKNKAKQVVSFLFNRVQ